MILHLKDGTTRDIRPGEALMGWAIVRLELTAEDIAHPYFTPDYYQHLFSRFAPVITG